MRHIHNHNLFEELVNFVFQGDGKRLTLIWNEKEIGDDDDDDDDANDKNCQEDTTAAESDITWWFPMDKPSRFLYIHRNSNIQQLSRLRWNSSLLYLLVPLL